MEIEKGKTAKYLREKRKVSDHVKENLKYFNRVKKALLTTLKEENMTVPELAEKLEMAPSEIMYNLMTLQKFGFVETAEIDDDDEYFYYKIKA
ncbi:MAG TPA: ArsR family transcriptional regulator [Sunxiuqinia sp.]|nr:ArsR family transcriptional regulator [Sunxiuqinia sp.]